MGGKAMVNLMIHRIKEIVELDRASTTMPCGCAYIVYRLTIGSWTHYFYLDITCRHCGSVPC